MPRHDNHHNTLHELEFIAKLGSWGERPRDRQVLLEKYFEAAKERDIWITPVRADRCYINLNRKEVIRAAAKELLRCR